MNAQLAKRHHSPTPSTKASARALAKLANAPHVVAAARVDTASERPHTKDANNPLWVIAIAMGAFFGATALIMMV